MPSNTTGLQESCLHEGHNHFLLTGALIPFHGHFKECRAAELCYVLLSGVSNIHDKVL